MTDHPRQVQSALSVSPSEGGQSYQLPPGTSFILCHHTMSNSTAWVRHPELFLPDRWRRGSNIKVFSDWVFRVTFTLDVSIDQPIRQFTIWVRAQNVYREENFLDGDQFCVGRFAPEVRGWLGGAGTDHQDGDPRLSSHSAPLYVSGEKSSFIKPKPILYFIEYT